MLSFPMKKKTGFDEEISVTSRPGPINPLSCYKDVTIPAVIKRLESGLMTKLLSNCLLRTVPPFVTAHTFCAS